MRISKYHFLELVFFGIISQCLQAQPGPTSADFFETKIRPILANNCYGCHTNSAMGGLRMDSLEALKKGGEHGSALTPGDPDKSSLISRVKETNQDLRMPKGGKLKPAEIADLESWVKGGALWPKSSQPAAVAVNGKYTISPERRNFWSFKPLQTLAPPAVKNATWARNDIDRFVLASLEKEGLKPVNPATKRDLIRRATLDLIGLPPTPEDIVAFEKDSTPNAFTKIVDRLLASPQYGERWGREWLDVARYGEDDYRSLNMNPKGYRPYPNAFAYRDWVIQAINDDMPYDQFVKAQLAGDLMDVKVRQKMLPATGFLGLGPWYFDNGSNEVTRADERHDRVDAVTRGFMGITVACARCHDHKYDPIPQKDYYALAGVFFNTVYEEYPRAPKKVVDEFTKLESDLDKKQALLMETNQAVSSELSRTLALQAANYLMGVWDVTGRPKKEMEQVVEARKLDFELLNRWIKYMAKSTDKYKNKEAWQALIKKGGGTQPEAKKLADQLQEEIIAVMLERNELEAENKVIVDKDMDGTKPKKRTDKPSNFTSYRDFNPGSWLRLRSLPDDQNSFWTEIFQRELKEADDPNAMMDGGSRMGNPGVLLFRGWALESRIGAEAQARLKSVQTDIEAARKKMEPFYPFIHGVKESDKPVNIALALRGNPDTLGEEVPRHFLSVFSENEPFLLDQGSGRMQLADQILKQPITMRVMVNRVWKGHFGTGIVDTPSNFGFGGERPTNPELLEYLAQDFLKNGMSIKQLHRKIMISSTYQLSTQMDKVAFDKDSGNRLYWRANPRRMNAEQLRDSILAVAGNLDDALGGPSQELTPAFTRRTVYGKVSRYKLDSYLQLFDFPSPSISTEKRFSTTVPLQRLFLMNSDFMQLESEELAKRVGTEPDNRARIRKVYLLAYGREPKEDEIKLGLEFLRVEPLRAFEENKKTEESKKKSVEPGAPAGRKPHATEGEADPHPETTSPISDLAKPEPAANGILADAAPGGEVAPAEAAMGMGMMGGMGRRGVVPPAPEVKYEATAWGRYVKVLLSSSEFMFIN